MEDYLEMICRMLRYTDVIRVHTLADNLHVKPSSASQMVGNLKERGYVEFKRYGHIAVTEKGRESGAYLLHRHQVLHQFLCVLNQSENELEQVEKIEHFINAVTVANLEQLIPKLLGGAGKPPKEDLET
ncbi:MAG: metal-dependent transcriptional regulator [Clostridiales bacterium]